MITEDDYYNVFARYQNVLSEYKEALSDAKSLAENTYELSEAYRMKVQELERQVLFLRVELILVSLLFLIASSLCIYFLPSSVGVQ